MGHRRRVGAYGVCRDADGRVLLARGSARSEFPGVWSLPGGGVEQGEHPDAAVVREFAEETGLVVRVESVRLVTADVVELSRSGDREHTDRIIYDVVADRGELRDEIDGTTDRVAWAGSGELAGWPLMPFTAAALGLPVAVAAPRAGGTDRPVTEPIRAVEGDGSRALPDVSTTSVQRFGAYGVVTDPARRILLTRIATGYPGAGLWHLPGGGTDHGEAPQEAIRRELAEESGQLGRVDGLLAVSHRHDPAALGPEGHPVDWYVVRAVFRVFVDRPTEPVVTEAAGGSTLRSAWFPPDRLAGLTTTEVTEAALAALPTSGK